MFTPFTYLIGWKQHDRWYYGVRYKRNCHPNDLWSSYFTSSKQVKAFREEHGEPDVIEVRQTFNDSLQAREWEEKVLRRMRVVKSERWLNKTDRHAFSPRFGSDNHNFGRFKGEDNVNFGKSTPEETKKKISQTLLSNGKVEGENNGMFGRKHTDDSKRKMSDNRRSYDGENNPNFGKTTSLITREKISKKNKGKMWVTDGAVSLLIRISETIPEGFRRGRKING